MKSIRNIGAEGYSFFDRLSNGEPSTRTRYREINPKHAIISIKNNLHRVLNARQGHALSAKDLGLLDLNDASNTDGDVFSEIEKEIQKTILAYEPRIVGVSIKLLSDLNDPASLKISVIAEVNLHPNQESLKGVVINITYDRDKRYCIE
ncbi:type VI secretion system baseplate subunit TssE [Ignatzschineria larvae DSM 13226]|uniref:Type VI secretion system baseplate subunit TssE n=1 Tax=Ignatzschineria larvae DSM 13226 TaxID=1111732 RepID=A0ABZ3C380_9GAMM|nr:type VI secretion system baseplate subunit TssE [Ignatzschineria larvae]